MLPPPGNTTVKFPDAINQKTFKIESSADTSRSIKSSDTAEKYYYITTDDTKVTVDACVKDNEDKFKLTSFTTDVNITIDNNVCTATTSDGSTYTFTINSNTLSSITVENKADTTLNITSSTVEAVTRPNNWTLEFKKYEGLSESTTGAMRMMVTPIGIYIAETYPGTPTKKEDVDWTDIKSADFFRYDTITADTSTEGKFIIDIAIEGSSNIKYTISVEKGGYKVFHDTGDTYTVENDTFHVKESNNYEASFFSTKKIQSYFTSSSGE